MKKRFYCLLLTAFFISLNSFGQIRSNRDLIGIWENSGLKIEFFADGRVGLVMQGGTMPGATFKTDFFKNPATLSIIITQAQKKMNFKSDIFFINDSTLKMEETNNDPQSIYLKGHPIILKKIR